VEEVRGATSVDAATYLYDHPDLQAVFLKRLRGRGEFSLDMTVDRQEYTRGKMRYMGPRLRELVKAGATIRLASGIKHEAVFGRGGRGLVGHCHLKAVVLDKRVAYFGSANFTKSMETNSEIMTRVVGGQVKKVWETVAACRKGSTLAEAR